MIGEKLAFLRVVIRAIQDKLGLKSKATLSVATLTASVAAPVAAQDIIHVTPPRPPYYSPTDTIHRYGEKFVLSPTDSVVIRADTVWYPRKTSALPRTLSSPTPTAPSPSYPSSGGGSVRGHQSHYSHSSHSSHSSHRSGGWQ